MKNNKQNKKPKNRNNVEASKELTFEHQCNNKKADGKSNCKNINKNK
jgi:hypothetical protein